MFWKPIAEKFHKVLKEHKEHCPLPVIIYVSWPILPPLYGVMFSTFAALLFIYDIIRWHYKDWGQCGVPEHMKTWAKVLHYGVSGLLLLVPLTCIAFLQLEHRVPKWLDDAVVSATSDATLTNKLGIFVFGVGTPQPTNYTASLIGIASPSGAYVFESQPLLHNMSAYYVTLAGIIGAWCLLGGAVGIIAVGVYESIAESMSQMPDETGAAI